MAAFSFDSSLSPEIGQFLSSKNLFSFVENKVWRSNLEKELPIKNLEAMFTDAVSEL